jgi:hypothetical protein
MTQLYAVPCCLYFNSVKYYRQLFNVILRMVFACGPLKYNTFSPSPSARPLAYASALIESYNTLASPRKSLETV